LETSPSISSVIQPGVVSVGAGAAVSEVARIMAEESVRNVFVMRGGEPIGLIRDWDIITRVVAFNLDPDIVKVDEIMYTPAPAVTLYAELSDIAALMAESGVRRVLVTDRGKILGTITAGSLLAIASSYPKGSLYELHRSIQRET
jgi:predicted transcriptional regulator